ncbi:hypothetical protein MFLAVUS_000242 [Mucor flavus]|uniref:Tc1-like transposase DDE domain-containing protein n=1 Tax=Mucor flavus TaxID=439312 RepID=A0ABP9YJ63_9FUNG
MSTYFFYENGQGKIYDEQGKDAMEWVEEVDPFHLETLTTLRKYQQAQLSEQEWMRGELDETMNEVALRTKEEGNKKSGKIGTPAIVETKSTKATSHTILGAISAMGVVDIELRVAEKPKQRRIDGVGRKRKHTPNVKKSKGTATGHYLNFIQKTLNEMDKTPLMNGFYIVIDNAPTHTHSDIDELIALRGYRSIYLSPYSPELNPIEQFWSVVKNKVKRGTFSDDEDLKTRIVDACNNAPIQHYLPKSIESLSVSINDIDLYDWIDRVGVDNALKLAEVMSKLPSAFLEWLPYKDYETVHENIGESDMTIFFKLLNAFKGDKKVSCASSFSDFRSVHNSMRFSGGNLPFYYGLKYEDLFDRGGEERIFELSVPDRTISVIGPEVINSSSFYICTTDKELAFKLLKYSLINCSHLQRLKINGMDMPRQECILYNSIDHFRRQEILYDPSTISAETLKAVNLKGLIPSQECLDLLSSYLPGIQIFTCTSERGNRFDDCGVPQNNVVDLTHFKSLQTFYFDVQLILTGPKVESCVVKFEYMDGEKTYYRFKNEKNAIFESISLEDVQNNQTSTIIDIITFRCEKIEAFTLHRSEKCNVLEIHRGLPQKERRFSYEVDYDYVNF